MRRPGDVVYVLRHVLNDGQVVPAISRGRVTSKDNSAIAIRFDNGTGCRIPHDVAARTVWSSEPEACEELARRGPAHRITPHMGMRAVREDEAPAFSPSKPPDKATPPMGLAAVPSPAAPAHAPRSSTAVERMVWHPPPPSPLVYKPLGAYMRLVIAGSHWIAGQRHPLSQIALGHDEAEVADAVARETETFARLSVEEGIRWGALYLYVFARTRQGQGTRPVTARKLSPAHVNAIGAGARLWRSEGIPGVDGVYDTLRPTVSVSEEHLGSGGSWHVEAERLERNRGLERIRVRALEHEVEEPSAAISLALRVPNRPDIRVKLEDAPGARLSNSSVKILFGDDWTEISFRLLGPRLERVPLEVFVPSLDEDAVPVEGEFSVGQDSRRGRPRAADASEPAAEAPVVAAPRASCDVYVRQVDPVAGMHRFAVRVVSRRRDETLPVRLRLVIVEPPEGTRVRGTNGGVALAGGSFELAPDDTWSDLRFEVLALDVAIAERVRLAIEPAETELRVRSVRVPGIFRCRPDMQTATGPNEGTKDPVRAVFAHMKVHGYITEPEVVAILGSPRAFRTFSDNVEKHAATHGCRVRIEMTESGKRYIREASA